MKIKDILKTVGSNLIKELPMGNLLLSTINSFLPDDRQLGGNATGIQFEQTIQTLSSDQQTIIMNKQLDVDLKVFEAQHKSLREMFKSDALLGEQSTRPKIALGSFYVIGIAILTTICMWSYAVLLQNDTLVETIISGWPLILAILSPLTVLLHSYFGVLTKIHKNNLDLVSSERLL